MRACRACGYEHETLMRCDVARRIRGAGVANAVANGGDVANADASLELAPVVKPERMGRYADGEKRKAYMRELMRKRRAEGRA